MGGKLQMQRVNESGIPHRLRVARRNATLPRPRIQPMGKDIQLVLGTNGTDQSGREILAQESIGILVWYFRWCHIVKAHGQGVCGSTKKTRLARRTQRRQEFTPQDQAAWD